MFYPSRGTLNIAGAALLFGLFKCVAASYTSIDINGDGVYLLAEIPISVHFYRMLPYLITLVVLAFTSKKSRAPKAEGVPYDKGQLDVDAHGVRRLGILAAGAQPQAEPGLIEDDGQHHKQQNAHIGGQIDPGDRFLPAAVLRVGEPPGGPDHRRHGVEPAGPGPNTPARATIIRGTA